MPYTYVLECADGTLYVGSTFDPERRISQHQPGERAEYTRRRQHARLVWNYQFDSREVACWLPGLDGSTGGE